MTLTNNEQTSAVSACLRLLFGARGTVAELRIPNTPRGTVSGYFNDLDKLAAAAGQWSGKAPGIYFTLNPVTPALLARANNHLVEHAKQTTSDSDTLRRGWLPLDFDPVRPSGISSTDAEHETALARARECAAWLRSLGFGAVILADSGNGAHVLVRIDLPNDATSTALIKRCLAAVALRFSDETVSVDLSVFNAARIWKCYGTLACKGDSTPERPHRIARIIEVADDLTPTPHEVLEKLAALAPEEPKTHARQTYSGQGAFDLVRWISDHTLDVIGPSSWQGGQKWLFPVCPWNPDHTNRSAYLVQFATDAIAAGCHHNGCQGKDWHALRDLVEPGWRERCTAPPERPEEAAEDRTSRGGAAERPNPWLLAKSAPEFLAEEEKEFTGLAKDLVAPGAITLIASPKGIGKTQVAHALAVALGSSSGVFRGEHVRAVRVLLLDRENPVSTLKKRLRAWGAAAAENLHVLTRQDAPDLKDRKAWEAFPAEQYDVLIVDSVGTSTEGITEKEGKQNSEVLATLLDLAHRDIAILLLQNTEKTGTNIRGRGEWADRADIQYEVRDATGFTPSGKRPWWQELPADGAANWAERAARHKGRTVFRLAFIPAKFRLAAEPEPFCLEILLPENEPWTLRDVTDEIVKAGEETVAKAEQAKSEKLEKAAVALAEVVKARAASGEPLLKTEAEEYLQQEHLSRDAARSLIAEKEGMLWRIEQVKTAPGRPKALYPTSVQPDEPRKYNPLGKPHEMGARETPISAGTDSKPRENTPPQKDAKNGLSEDTLFSRPHSNTAAEIPSQKSPSIRALRDTDIFADEEVEKQDLDAEVL